MDKNCALHEGQEATHVCKTCGKLMCIYCTIKHEASHKTITLMDHATKIMKKLYQENKSNANIKVDIEDLKNKIRRHTNLYWNNIKLHICNTIDHLKECSLRLIDGILEKEEMSNKLNGSAKGYFMELFDKKNYYEIYKNSGIAHILSQWEDKLNTRKQFLKALYDNFRSLNFGHTFEYIDTYLLKVQENFYSTMNSIQNCNYGIYLNDNALNLVYVPFYVDSIPLSKSPYNVGIVQTKNQVYFIGGNRGKWDSEYFATTYSIPLLGRLVNEYLDMKAPMKFARAWHGVTELQSSYIYAIGGYNSIQGTLGSCEKYIVKNDKWVPIPSLQKKRWGLSITLFNERLIYGFFGAANKRLLNTIEVFDCLDEEKGWVLIPNKNYRSAFFQRCQRSFQSSNTEIIIFGGDEGNKAVKGYLTYKVKENIIQSTDNEYSCDINLSYYCFPKRMKGSQSFKVSTSNAMFTYNMIKKTWALNEVFKLKIVVTDS